MKLKLGTKKIDVLPIDRHWERFKTLKFDLKPLTKVILFKNRKYLSTYFFCQKVDVIMTDDKDIILYMFPNYKTEKIIFYKRKVTNIYILPLDSCKNFTIGQKLVFINQKKDNH